MKTRSKRWMKKLAIVAGAMSAAGVIVLRQKKKITRRRPSGAEETKADVWARPGMRVVFRAELMPGQDAAERIYTVEKLLPSNRVTLRGITGEHAENEFEPIRR